MSDFFKIHVLDVGQGDSIVLETGGDHGESSFSLIDCKSCSGNAVPAVDFLQERNVRDLHAIFLSHHHLDHAEGFPALAEHLTKVQGRVDYFVCPNLPQDAELRREILNKIHDRVSFQKITEIMKSVKTILALSNREGTGRCRPISFMFEGNVTSSAGRDDIHPGLKIIPLSPQPDQAREYLSSALSESTLELNELSHVLWFQPDWHGRGFLFSGDLEGKPWANVKNNILKVKNSQKADVAFFKVPHHGAKNYHMEKHLPEIIKNPVIFSLSTPAGSKHHPHKETINFLKTSFPKSELYCTGLALCCADQVEKEGLEHDFFVGKSEVGRFDEFAVSSRNHASCMGSHTVFADKNLIGIVNDKKKNCFYL